MAGRSLPGIPDNVGFADVVNLLNYIPFDKSVKAVFPIAFFKLFHLL